MYSLACFITVTSSSGVAPLTPAELSTLSPTAAATSSFLKSGMTLTQVFTYCNPSYLLCWGARDGAVVRALASHQCGLGLNPGIDTTCGLSLLLVLSFPPRGFPLGTPVFLSPQKPTFPNSNSTRNQVDEEPLCWMCYLKTTIYLFLYIQ